jgi:hypothetical protein
MGRASSIVASAAIVIAAVGLALAADNAPAPVQLPGISATPQPAPTPEPLSPNPALPSGGAAPANGPVPPGAADGLAPAPGDNGAPGAASPPAQPEGQPQPPLRGTGADQGPLDLGVKPPPEGGTAPDAGAAGEPGAQGGESLISPAEQHRELHESWPAAVLRGLDKVTARVTVVTAPIGKPVMFGRLQITARYCYKRPPEETPEVNGFIQIDDKHVKDAKAARVFSGWMFASSPGLHGLEHPTYDVWLIDCKASTPEIDFGSAPKAPAPKQLELKHNK